MLLFAACPRIVRLFTGSRRAALVGANGDLFPFEHKRNYRLVPHLADNVDYLKSFPTAVHLEGVLPRAANGFIYSDPNGVNHARGGLPDVVVLTETALQLPRFVIAIYYPWQAALRVQGYNVSHDGAMAVTTVDDILSQIPRDYWLVSESTPHGRIALCGSFRPIPERRNKPPYFYRLETDDGQRLLQQMRGKK
jgi:hypothetical protein